MIQSRALGKLIRAEGLKCSVRRTGANMVGVYRERGNLEAFTPQEVALVDRVAAANGLRPAWGVHAPVHYSSLSFRPKN